MKKLKDKHYFVVWEIDIWAASPKRAAEQALAIQRDIRSSASCFRVVKPETGETVEIDLEESKS